MEASAAARATDPIACNGPKDYIVTGSGTVLIGARPAARTADLTMHGGVVSGGRAQVLIGGPRTGSTLGAPGFGNRLCKASASSRFHPGSTQQSFSNCGCEAARQILLQEGKKISEEDLLREATANGLAKEGQSWKESGATTASSRQKILQGHGVESTLEDATLENVIQAVADGKGVISSHKVDKLWGVDSDGGHAILVTGVVYDENGSVVKIVTNDTGRLSGNCSRTYDPESFGGSLKSKLNVTVDPIMKHPPGKP